MPCSLVLTASVIVIVQLSGAGCAGSISATQVLEQPGDDGEHLRTISQLMQNNEDHPVHFGKLREPLLQATHLWRLLGVEDSPEIVADPDCCWRDAIYRPENYFGQAALRSPSVFNFFTPDYAPPGGSQ